MDDRRREFRASLVRFLLTVVTGMALGILSAPVLAQDYPSRLIRIVVAFAPGGVPDILARVLAKELQTTLGSPVVVNNRQGGGGLIGSDAVAKAPPDGYTLLLGSTGSQAIAPALYSKFPYDPRKDLTPVSLVAKSGNVLVVNPALPVKNVKDLIALAKAKPGTMNYASAGNGSVQEELLAHRMSVHIDDHITSTKSMLRIQNTSRSLYPYRKFGEQRPLPRRA